MKTTFTDRVAQSVNPTKNTIDSNPNSKTLLKSVDINKSIDTTKTDPQLPNNNPTYVIRVINTQSCDPIDHQQDKENPKNHRQSYNQNQPILRNNKVNTTIPKKSTLNYPKNITNFKNNTNSSKNDNHNSEKPHKRPQTSTKPPKPSNKKSPNSSFNFKDKHMSLLKKTNDLTEQPYKKFDISKLDFSFDCNLNDNQLSAQKLTKQKEYASLVYRSRSNIKKIIELNKFLKESQKQQIPLQKTKDEKFISDLEILDKIKVGCFGTVFKARIISSGKLIAIKSIPYDREHQQREDEICRLIDNPFIVKIHKVYYTSDLEVERKQKVKEKPKARKTQTNMLTFQQMKNEIQTCKSVRKLAARTPTKNNLEITQQKDQAQLNLNDELKKNFLTKTKQSRMEQHYKEYHRVINIAMDLYDCDLNDYIMTKMKIDNLTLKLFCYQMIRSLLYLHSHQICHRDIKPSNFLVKKHLVVLTDFGSAKIMKNHKNSNVAYICSRYYRAPQLILGYRYYDKPVDIWSLGCVMAELSLGKPIFKGSNSLDQLVRIIRVIGQPNWRKISFMMDKIPKLPEIQSKGLKNIFPSNVSTLFIDLLESMLVINPLERITAGEALCHPFFDQIRDQMNFQQICKEMNISHFLKFNRDELKQNEHLKNKLIPLWAVQPDKYDSIKTNNYFRS